MPIRADNRNVAAFTLIELAVVICIFLLMILVLTPFVKMAKNISAKHKCVNNLRKMSLGLHKYAAEHNGRFPAELGDIYPGYLAEEAVFNCPATKKQGTEEDPEYIYYSGLIEASPADSIILADMVTNHGKSGRNVVRVGGVVEWVED